MIRFCARTIACLLILTLLPGYAGVTSAVSDAEVPQTVTIASPPAPMPSLTSDQLSKLYEVYTIQRGDCLISIGEQFGVSWRYIAGLNGIKGPKYMIIAGQTLKIPLLPKLPGTTGNYLILCETEAQAKCLTEFAAFKTWSGFTVTVKSVEADVKPAAKADPCEAIRKYLKKMDKKLSLEYVLLIGDPHSVESRCPQHTGGVIPMRYMYGEPSNHNTIYGTWFDENQNSEAFNTPTDIYYAFDFNWDYDADGYAGERDEITESFKQAEPKLLFLLGRVPFSDTKDIGTMLNATMQYELGQKTHSDALIESIGDFSFYGEALAENLNKANIETTAICSDLEPYEFESANPSSVDYFNQEINKKYDFVYTNNDFLFELVPNEDVPIGLLFMDSPNSMMVEPWYDQVCVQDFLANGTVCASIAVTRGIGFNPNHPDPRMASLLFSNGTLCVSREFYTAMQLMIMESNVPDAYIYCYLGDPSITLKP